MPKTIETTEKETDSPRRKTEHPHKRFLNGPDPIVRIGLMEEYDRIDFTLNGVYDLTSLDGDTIEAGVESEQRWHIMPDQTTEARAIFSVLITAFARKDAADKLRRSLSQLNHPSRVVEVGEQIIIDDRVVADNVKYRVLVGRWPTPREAAKHMNEFREDYVPRVVRQIIRPATGTIELTDEDFGNSRSLKNGFRLVPRSPENNVILHDVREGTGFHWEREVDRSYPGVVEIRVDHRGLLMSLVELPLELYLQGVVPAEMPASYPAEALKTQAVAARSEVLAKMGVKHPNDPFDLCAHVHCQAYAGCTHYDERATKAVNDTRGFVLMLDNQVAEAVYSSCCGGHTEDKLNVWNPPDAAHLKGRWDTDNKKVSRGLDLSTESGVEKWVNSSPDVWCNTANRKDISRILELSERVFRWEVIYTCRELEEIIRRKSGEDIGSLINIVPLERGVSGRLMEIEIQGSRRNLRIQRELNIRNMLSLTYLYSACFTVEVDEDELGQPVSFHLIGAGWGHGVGMCQVGAGTMAHSQKKFKEILTHYYPGTEVERVYSE